MVSKIILGVKIDDVSSVEAIKIVYGWFKNKPTTNNKSLLNRDKQPTTHLIFTSGPEFLVTAQKDEEFKKILNNSDLNIPDGFGLQLYGGIKNRIPGRDFMISLCKEAAEKGWTIGLVGGWKNDGLKASQKLKLMFPKIQVTLIADGEEATKIKNGYDIDIYIKQSIDILFLGLGHPWQERILWKLKNENCKFRVGMGVGGAIDYLAGRYPQPPKIFQAMGLEWFWRLITQPWRLGRIIKATILFPLLLLLNYFRG